MTEKTAGLLKNLAQKYEVSSFTESDPSRFLSWYSDVKNVGFLHSLMNYIYKSFDYRVYKRK